MEAFWKDVNLIQSNLRRIGIDVLRQKQLVRDYSKCTSSNKETEIIKNFEETENDSTNSLKESKDILDKLIAT